MPSSGGRTLIGALVAAALFHAQLAMAAEMFDLDMPAQQLAVSLRTVGSKTNTNVLADAATISALSAPALHGKMTAEQAIAKLTEGMGLRYEFINDRIVTISAAGAKPADAEVSRPETSVGGEKPRAGTFNTSRIRLAEGGLASSGADVSAESGHSASSSQSSVDVVVVTGSRLRRDKSESEEDGPAPVAVFSRKKIESLGVTNVGDVLSYLSQQPFAVREGNSFAASRTVQLRGLPLGTTLVLINGRRTVTSALLGSRNAFDLNTIPLSAVERIDVLANSASAVYGADAIGGVVNVILKKEVPEPVIDLYLGGAADGARERRASIAAGFDTGRTKLSATFDAFDRSALMGSERPQTANQDYRALGGTDQRTTIASPANISSLTAANLPGLPSRVTVVPAGSSGVGLTPADFLATAGEQSRVSLLSYSSIVPESKRLSAALFGEHDFTDRTKLSGEFLYADREDTVVLFPPLLIATVPAQNPFNPFQVPVLASLLLTDMDTRQTTTKADSYRGVLALNSSIGQWDWEVSLLRTDERGTNRNLNNVSTPRINAALAATDPAQALNVFVDGPPGSPALLASLVADPVTNHDRSSATQGSAFLRGPIFETPWGTASAVFGGESRSEEIHFEATSTIVDADRHSNALYTEFLVPLWKSIKVTVAGRYDDYDDFGGTLNPEYGVQWRPMSTLLFRATYGTSFRPPSLYELYAPVTATASAIVDPRRGNQQTLITSRSGGNPELEPERSNGFTGGVVFTPDLLGLRIEASYWRIQMRQRVQPLNGAVLLANESLFPGRIIRAPATAADAAAGFPGQLLEIDSTSINFGHLATSGADISARATFGYGFGATLAATRVSHYEASDVPGAAPVERVGVGNVSGTIPRWRAVSGVDWNMAGFGVGATVRYLSSYADVTSTNVRNGLSVNSTTLFDLQASVSLARWSQHESSWDNGVVIRLGAMNLFDKQPPFSTLGSGFDPNTGDLRGRFAYLNITKAFK